MHKVLMIAAVPFALALGACQSQTSPAPKKAAQGGQESTGTGSGLTTYNSWVSGYLASACVNCHGAGGQPYAPDLSNYNAAKTQAGAIIADMQKTSNWMPKGGAKPTDAQISQMQAWISGGLQQAATSAPGTSSGYPTGSGSTGYPAGTPGTSGTPSTSGTAPSSVISYTGWVQGYLTSAGCSSGACHSQSGRAGAIVTDNYQDARTNAAAILSSMKDQSMPQGGTPATSDQIAKMQAWITAGEPQNDTSAAQGGASGTPGYNPSTLPLPGGTPSVTYAGQIQALMARACTNCHGPGGTKPDLSTQQGVQRVNDVIWQDVESGRMPEGTSFTQQDKDLVKQWVNSGAF